MTCSFLYDRGRRHYILAFCYFSSSRQAIRPSAPRSPPGAMQLPETVRASTVFEQGGVRVALEDERRGTRRAPASACAWPDSSTANSSPTCSFEQPARSRDAERSHPVEPHRFQFTSKQNTLRASGTIALGRERIRVKRNEAFAAHDFGRGVWKNRTAWNWGASSSVLPDGRTPLASTSLAPGPTAPA